jgi:hypothetical protein
MTKKDYIEVITLTLAVMLLGCCLFVLGTLKGREMMYIQAIANGAGTYNEEGEFVWIKK